MEFKAWPKITRVENRRPPFFTEKIDGTNACIVISYDAADDNTIAHLEGMNMWAQSRNKFIKPGDDNFGFASWAQKNAVELFKMGEGHHYGEWWGLGIGRGYGLTEKRFSLFNAHRWGEHNPNTPACASVVPILRVNSPEAAALFLKEHGSQAVPGWNRPEGAVMFDRDAECYFKIIIDK